MKKAVFSLIFVFAFSALRSQSYEKKMQVNGANPYGMKLLEDTLPGTYIMVGGAANNKLFVTHFNDTTVSAICKIINTTSSENIDNIKKSALGNNYYMQSKNQSSHFVTKFDSAFNITYRFSLIFPIGINNYNGTSFIEFANGETIFLWEKGMVCADGAGTVIWAKSFSNYTEARGLKKLGEYGFLIFSNDYSSSINFSSLDLRITKFTRAGLPLWNKYIGTFEEERLSFCINNSDENTTLFGSKNSTNNYDFKPFTVLLDTSANILNSILINNLPSIIFNNAIDNYDGTYTCLAQANAIPYLLRFDSLGNAINCKKSSNIQYINTFMDSSFFSYRQALNSDYFISKSKPNQIVSCTNDSILLISNNNFPLQSSINSNFIINPLSTLVATNITTSNGTFTLTNNCVDNCEINAQINSHPNQFCINSNHIFSTTSIGNGYQWKINGALVGTNSTLNFNFSTIGTKQIQLIINNGSCVDTANSILEILSPITSSINFENNFLELIAVPNNISGNSYFWNFGDNDSIFAFDTVIHNYDEPGNYNVCLTSTNICGSSNYCQAINIYIPYSNAFVVDINSGGGLSYQFDAIQLPSGNFIVAGQIGSPSTRFEVLNPQGEGQKVLGLTATSGTNIDNQYAEKLFLDNNNNILFTGFHTYSFTGTKALFGILNKDLDFTAKNVAVNSFYEHAAGMAQCADGNYIIAYAGFGKTNLLKVDNAGITMWRNSYNGTNDAKGVKTYNDGSNLVLCANNNNAGIELFKTDSIGNLIWAYNYTGPATNNLIYDFEKTKNGDVLICGDNNASPFIMRLDSAGNILWSKYINLFNNHSARRVRNVVETLNGNIAFSYDQSNAPYGTFGYLGQLDANGNLIQVFKEDGYLQGMNATLDSGLVAIWRNSAYFNSGALVKYDKNLQVPCYFTSDTGTVQDILFMKSNFPYTVVSPTPPSSVILGSSGYSYGQSIDSANCYNSINGLVANFNYTAACPGDSLQFTNNSSGNFNTVNWHFTDAIVDTSTLNNPTAVWSNSGNYSVILTISDSLGNSSTNAYDIQVYNVPIVGMYNQTACMGTQKELFANGSGNLNTVWGPAGIGWLDSLGASAILVPIQSGQVYLTSTNIYGCSFTDTAFITVNPLPILSLSGVQDTICENELSTIGVDGANQYNWYNNGTLFCIGDSLWPYNFIGSANVDIEGISGLGCMDTISFSIYEDTCQIVTQLKRKEFNNSFSVSPNPSSDFLIVKSNLLINNVEYQIYNSIGQVILTGYIHELVTKIEVKSLANGPYQLRILYDNNFFPFSWIKQ